MTNIRNDDKPNNFSSVETADGFVLHGAAAGDLNNYKIKTCKVCADNGFPNEPIIFEKLNGRVLSDGTNEIAGYRHVGYFTNREHRHKDAMRDLGPILWSKIYGHQDSNSSNREGDV